MTRLTLLSAAALLLSACAVQKRCGAHPWLLCGDRITVQRPFVYLDDPAFLYNNKVPAHAEEGRYTFRLSFFLNPYQVQSARLTAEIRTPDSASVPSTCRVTPGDSGSPVAASPRKERVSLRFHCPEYRPRWGRKDTLELRFAGRAAGADTTGTGSDDPPASLVLPFTTSFHGPVYSFLAGSLLLVGLTATGEIIASDK
jgi:hypothetical protein